MIAKGTTGGLSILLSLAFLSLLLISAFLENGSAEVSNTSSPAHKLETIESEVDLIGDQRLRFGDVLALDISALRSAYGQNIEITGSIDGCDNCKIGINRDKTKLVVSSGLLPPGSYSLHLTGRISNSILKEEVRLFVNPDKFSDIEPEVLDTALIDLPMRTLYLSGLSKDILLPRGAMGILGSRLLISAYNNQYFEVNLEGETVSMRPLKLGIDTNNPSLQEYVKSIVFIGDAVAEVQDILFLKDGKHVAISYSHWNSDAKCLALRVELGEVPKDWKAFDAIKWSRIFESTPCLPLNSDYPNIAGNAAGGRLAELSSGELLLTVGNFAKEIYPQKPHNSYGKVYKLNMESGRMELLSLGHRNPQGIAVDPLGRIWTTEHGPRGGDELNLIVKGQNAGWPNVTYGVNYHNKEYGGQEVAGRHDGFSKPVYAWVPSIGATSVVPVHGFSKEWEGDLLVSSLKARQLRRLRLEENRVVYDEPINLGSRLRDSGQLDDGRIVILTDEAELLVLSPTKFPDANKYAYTQAWKLGPQAQAALSRCNECHSFSSYQDNTNNKLNLAGVFGRRIACLSNFSYSKALAEKNGNWTEELLNLFISDPNTFAPGTLMSGVAIEASSVRSEIIGYLKLLALNTEIASRKECATSSLSPD